ncbi:MAG TPA: putative toxin-antitoxin system toxin component, PIN family [Acidimicrobiales bacterium]|nr:putative toxin-antitoxin system toxin component, PIN family [Acidimicrobiales bacterium]
MRSAGAGRGRLRVVLDTNVWVSGLINPAGPPGQLLEEVRIGRIEAVLSWELADEVLTVLARPQLRRFQIAEEDVQELAALFAPLLPTVDVVVTPPDPDDAVVVAAAVGGGASVLVTGDRDLLDDRELLDWLSEHSVEVLRPAELVERLAGQR